MNNLEPLFVPLLLHRTEVINYTWEQKVWQEQKWLPRFPAESFAFKPTAQTLWLKPALTTEPVILLWTVLGATKKGQFYTICHTGIKHDSQHRVLWGKSWLKCGMAISFCFALFCVFFRKWFETHMELRRATIRQCNHRGIQNSVPFYENISATDCKLTIISSS